MAFFTSAHPKRTPAQRAIRYATGTLACALIIFILWLLPYDILREERYRIYGETRTSGMVLEMGADPTTDYPFMIRYKYIDADGIAREAMAPLDRERWEEYRPGNSIDVFYIRSRPNIVRITGELEPPFQLWLRDILQ